MNDALEQAGTSPPASEGFCCLTGEQPSPISSGEMAEGGPVTDAADGRFTDQPLENRELKDRQTNTCRWL